MVLFRSLASLAERGKKNLKFGLTTTKKNCQGIVTEPVKEECSTVFLMYKATSTHSSSLQGESRSGLTCKKHSE